MNVKAPKPKPKDEPLEMESSKPDTGTRNYTGKMYYVKRVNYLLSQAYEVELRNGVVVKETAISTEDLPNASIGTASRYLWNQVRGE